jgi:membrane protease YdiL (CAAX protease family)
MCSGYPTQIVIGEVLKALGISPLTAEGALSARFVFALSLSDTVVLLTLVVLLLRRNGESPRSVFFGTARVGHEIAYGIFSVPFVITLVIGLTLLIRAFAPGLHNVPDNPLEGLLGTQTGLLAFLFVVIVAGGLREELQRAFLLHRFRHDLRGPLMGLLITSLAFGLGHTLQGWDAAILTGALGAAWGAMSLARGSAVASIVSHSLFNSGELIRTFFR